MRRKTIALTTTLLLALSLTDCDTKDKGEITPAQSETTQSAPTEDETAPEAEPATAPVVEPEKTNPVFGETYTWPDGMAVTISNPTEYTPSEYSAGAIEGQTALSYEITINNGGENDLNGSMIGLTGISGGSEISIIFDTDNDMTMPTATILPGQSLTWTSAFSVADPADVTINVQVLDDFTRDEIHFITAK